MTNPAREISRDVSEWLQLARRQREELPRNGGVTPTDAGIKASEYRLRDFEEWYRVLRGAVQSIIITEGVDAGVIIAPPDELPDLLMAVWRIMDT